MEAGLHLLCVPDGGTPRCYSPRWHWMHSEALAKNIMQFPKIPSAIHYCKLVFIEVFALFKQA